MRQETAGVAVPPFSSFAVSQHCPNSANSREGTDAPAQGPTSGLQLRDEISNDSQHLGGHRAELLDARQRVDTKNAAA
eukprot:1879999-Pyramimonas_sp.AAC.1